MSFFLKPSISRSWRFGDQPRGSLHLDLPSGSHPIAYSSPIQDFLGPLGRFGAPNFHFGDLPLSGVKDSGLYRYLPEAGCTAPSISGRIQ